MVWDEKKKQTNKKNVRQVTRGDIVSCLFSDSGRSEHSQSFFLCTNAASGSGQLYFGRGSSTEVYIYFWGTRCVLFDLKRRFEFFKPKLL